MHNSHNNKYALLIDGENVSSKYIKGVINELNKYGTITIKRIYGNFTKSELSSWGKVLLEHSIYPSQQFNNSVGKNACDSALIIEAMDILYKGNVNGFCIVSSDGDFTRLAQRIREEGFDVIGIGEMKTPKSFRAACSKFIILENTVDTENTLNAKEENEEVEEVLPQSSVIKVITQIILENNDNGKVTDLGEIGHALLQRYNEFDCRNYGYSSLSKMLSDCDEFNIEKHNTTNLIYLKEASTPIDKIIEYIVEYVRESGEAGVHLGMLGQMIKQKYPKFNLKHFGYSSLKKFISTIKELRINETEATPKIYERK